MCIIDCLSTIVFILPLYLDDTKVIILILWRRTFQLEYWRTFQLVSTCGITYRNGYILNKKGEIIGNYSNGYIYDTKNDIKYYYSNGYIYDSNRNIIGNYNNGFVKFKTTKQ